MPPNPPPANPILTSKLLELTTIIPCKSLTYHSSPTTLSYKVVETHPYSSINEAVDNWFLLTIRHLETVAKWYSSPVLYWKQRPTLVTTRQGSITPLHYITSSLAIDEASSPHIKTYPRLQHRTRSQKLEKINV